MKNIIFLAPPAAGKGTQSKLLCDNYNFEHISTGDLLRAEVAKQTTIGKDIDAKMKSGLLIEDNIIFNLLIDKLNNEKNTEGYILDGFPRNIKQAEKYDEILKENNQKIDYVFYLYLSKEEAVKRITGRLFCPKCGSVYNEFSLDCAPAVKDICDKCNTTLIKRADDNVETINQRYDIYMNETKPLIDFYKNKSILYELDSSLDVTEIYNQIIEIIGVNL